MNNYKGMNELRRQLRAISEEYWSKSEQGWTSSQLCPNCKEQVELKQEDVGTDGKSRIQCSGCGTTGFGKFEDGIQWISWKLNPDNAYSRPYIGK